MWTYGDITVELITLDGRELFKAKSHGFMLANCKSVDELQSVLGPKIFAELMEVPF